MPTKRVYKNETSLQVFDSVTICDAQGQFLKYV